MTGTTQGGRGHTLRLTDHLLCLSLRARLTSSSSSSSSSSLPPSLALAHGVRFLPCLSVLAHAALKSSAVIGHGEAAAWLQRPLTAGPLVRSASWCCCCAARTRESAAQDHRWRALCPHSPLRTLTLPCHRLLTSSISRSLPGSCEPTDPLGGAAAGPGLCQLPGPRVQGAHPFIV